MQVRGFAARLGRLLIAAGIAWLLAGGPGRPSPSLAADPSPTPTPDAGTAPPVFVLSASGVVDSVMAGYIEESVRRAAERSSPALIVTLNTPGGSLDATQRIVSSLLEAPLPTIVWVAPSGARAASAGTFITLAANLAYMAPAPHRCRLAGRRRRRGARGHDRRQGQQDAIANIRSIAETRGRNVEWAVSTVDKAVSTPASEAVAIGAVERHRDLARRRPPAGRRPGRRGRRPSPSTVDIADAPVRRAADEPVPVDHPSAVGPEHRVHPADDRLLRAAVRAPEPELRDRDPRRDRADPRVHRLREPAAQRRRPAAHRPCGRPLRARIHGHQPRTAGDRRAHLLRARRVHAVHRARHADRARRDGRRAARRRDGDRHGGLRRPRAVHGRPDAPSR